MSYVLHTIKDNSGKGEPRTYLYEHFRDGDQVRSRYIMPMDRNDFIRKYRKPKK